MNRFKITPKQITNNEVSLEDIRDIFVELEVKSVADFNKLKKSGDLQVPSYDNLNALCKEKTGKKFEVFFFGNTELNFRIERKLIDEELVKEIKRWCSENNVITLKDYRMTKRPKHFPTYKATVNNYGVDYFYEVLGLQPLKPNFAMKLFDDRFVSVLKEWCINNKISSKNEYLKKKPHDFPSIERIRQLTGKSNYFKEILELDFKNFR